MYLFLCAVVVGLMSSPPSVMMLLQGEPEPSEAEASRQIASLLTQKKSSGEISSLEVMTVDNNQDVMSIFENQTRPSIVLCTCSLFVTEVISLAAANPEVTFVQTPISAPMPTPSPNNLLIIDVDMTAVKYLEGYLTAKLTSSYVVGYIGSGTSDVSHYAKFKAFTTAVAQTNENIRVILSYAATPPQVSFSLATLQRLGCDVISSDSFISYLYHELNPNMIAMSQYADGRIFAGRRSAASTTINWSQVVQSIVDGDMTIKATTNLGHYSSLVTEQDRMSLKFKRAHIKEMVLVNDSVANYRNISTVKLPHEACTVGTAFRMEVDGSVGCRPCPSGMYSRNASVGCQECPGGTAPNSDRSDCRECNDNEFGNGYRCLPCQPGYLPTQNKTMCIQCSHTLSENDICEDPESQVLLIIILVAVIVLVLTVSALVVVFIFRKARIEEEEDSFGLRNIIAVAEWRTEYLSELFIKPTNQCDEAKQTFTYRTWSAIAKTLLEVKPFFSNHLTKVEIKNMNTIAIGKGIGMRVSGIGHKSKTCFGLLDMVWCNTRLGLQLTPNVLQCRINASKNRMPGDDGPFEILDYLSKIPTNILRIEADAILCAFGAPQRKTAPIDFGIQSMLEFSPQYEISLVLGTAFVGIVGCESYKQFQVLHSPPDLSPALSRIAAKLPGCLIVNHELVTKFHDRIVYRDTGTVLLRSSNQPTHQLCSFDNGPEFFSLNRPSVVSYVDAQKFFSGCSIPECGQKVSDPLAMAISGLHLLSEVQMYAWRCTEGGAELVPFTHTAVCRDSSFPIRMSASAVSKLDNSNDSPLSDDLPPPLEDSCILPGAISCTLDTTVESGNLNVSCSSI